jgi:hypothetical protein
MVTAVCVMLAVQIPRMHLAKLPAETLLPQPTTALSCDQTAFGKQEKKS